MVVGDTTQAELAPALEKAFRTWRAPSTPLPVKAAAPALPSQSAPRVLIVDRAGPQSSITAGRLAPAFDAATEGAIDVANTALGGAFTSRINMNLREDKHWSYGARTVITSAQGQRPFLGIAPVQIDKTAESAAEMLREIAEYGTGKVPATQAEVTKVVDNDLRSQPGAYETAQAVMGTIGGIVRYGRPDNWVQVRNEQVANFTPAQARDAAKAIDPNALTWVIVGDLSKIEAPVRALKLGEVTVIDADGKPVAKAK